MNPSSSTPAHAIVPLALFESLRGLDAPPGELDDMHRDLTVKRLGMSQTVASQIERYGRLARGEQWVAADEVAGVLRLVGRRMDAGLVFADAGRRAGRHAARRVPVSLRAAWSLLPRAVRERLGFALARAAAARALNVHLVREGDVAVATIREPIAVHATPTGTACGFYGSAIAELLRTFTSFDSAMLHSECRARGGAVCVWRAA